MAVKLSEIRGALEEMAPLGAAEECDNPGLLLGRTEREVARVYVALDATREVAERAIETGAELLLTHHPVIFRGIKALNDESGQGEKLLCFLRADLSVYSSHTNFDSCPGGMGDLVCRRLGLGKLFVLEESHFPQQGFGIGFVAELPEEKSCRELAALVKERFGLPFVQFYDAGRRIRRIACCPGSGRGQFAAVLRSHADVFLSGDMGHHEGLDYLEEGISLIDAGHYGLEQLFVPYMAGFLRERFPGLELFTEETHFPAELV